MVRLSLNLSDIRDYESSSSDTSFWGFFLFLFFLSRVSNFTCAQEHFSADLCQTPKYHRECLFWSPALGRGVRASRCIRTVQMVSRRESTEKWQEQDQTSQFQAGFQPAFALLYYCYRSENEQQRWKRDFFSSAKYHRRLILGLEKPCDCLKGIMTIVQSQKKLCGLILAWSIY